MVALDLVSEIGKAATASPAPYGRSMTRETGVGTRLRTPSRLCVPAPPRSRPAGYGGVGRVRRRHAYDEEAQVGIPKLGGRKRQGVAWRTWALRLGVGAAGIAAFRLVRARRAGAESADPDLAGTAGGNPVAGLEMTDPNAVRTGIDTSRVAGEPLGNGASAPMEPVFGTTPNGGYLTSDR